MIVSRLVRTSVFFVGLVVATALPAANVRAASSIAGSQPLPPALQEWLKVRSEPRIVLDSTVVDGWTWSVVAPNKVPDGFSCDAIEIPLPPGTLRAVTVATSSTSGPGCLQASQLFWAGPLVQHHGWLNAGPAAAEWVWGQVSAPVKTVSVQLENCREVSVPISHGVFLYVAPDSAPAETTPIALIAKNADGATVKTLSLDLGAGVKQLPGLSGTPAANSSSSASSC